MVCDLEVKRSRPVQQEKFRPRRKVCKLRNPVARKRFEEVLDIEEGEGVNQMWEKTQDSLLKATEEVCGWTKGYTRAPWPSGCELRLSLERSWVLILVKVIGG